MPDKHISIDYAEKDYTRRRDPKRKKTPRRSKKPEEHEFVPEELKWKRQWTPR